MYVEHDQNPELDLRDITNFKDYLKETEWQEGRMVGSWTRKQLFSFAIKVIIGITGKYNKICRLDNINII